MSSSIRASALPSPHRRIRFRVVVGAGRVGTAAALSTLVGVYQRTLASSVPSRKNTATSSSAATASEAGSNDDVECVLLVEKDAEAVQMIRHAVSSAVASSTEEEALLSSFSSQPFTLFPCAVLPLTHTFNKGRVGGGATHRSEGDLASAASPLGRAGGLAAVPAGVLPLLFRSTLLSRSVLPDPTRGGATKLLVQQQTAGWMWRRQNVAKEPFR